ncbi:DUF6153 family protein [Streptomyces canus]|uniref:DUF6153 family protein n=1 Tax=Streptomyces canus TaxID=58343 RepID=UPI002254C176|nr:DUF6153 family protein [Streptomyces canus]MCX5252989.1 DUF6153 family protein [Streptomyces canus]
MTRSEHLPARPPLRRALLVLGMLVGVLAMHGLAPGGGLHGHEGSSSAHMTTVAVSVDATCHDGCGFGHLHHADVTCVSGAVSGGPVLPALAPDPASTAVSDDSLCPEAVMSQDGARAPPSLAELQLLRI